MMIYYMFYFLKGQLFHYIINKIYKTSIDIQDSFLIELYEVKR